MAHWMIGAWGQVWPNLAANVLWIPLAKLHIRRIRREHHEHIKRLTERG